MNIKNIIFLVSVFTILSTGCYQRLKEEKPSESEAVAGKYEANWQSLKAYEIPNWFQDAKFGIFIHWGPYSVPAFSKEWYPRLMYMDTATFSAQLNLQTEGPNKVYLHHKEHYGDQKEFGYKDFIPMFTTEKFDAAEWISLFKEAGAKYVVPVAEHHDGFAMYNSNFTRWNAVNMGPKRDIIKELFSAGREQGMKMGVSSHFAFNWAYYNKKPHFDTMDPEYADLYSKKSTRLDEPVSQEFKELWWNRTTDILDQYQPDILWLDFYVDRDEFKEYHPKLAAYYYNKGIEWDKGVVLQDKNFRYESFPEGTFVHDLERGKMSDIRKIPWQTDTSIGENSWSYVEDWESKDANRLIDDLVDIVSKNGCLLLNVGPKADGTIPEDQKDVLLEMGAWLKVNGEAIYDTDYWKVFGEGPTKVAEGYMSERKENKGFTAEDIRFTSKGDVLYAILLDWPDDNKIEIKSLGRSKGLLELDVKSVKLLDDQSKDLEFEQSDNFLSVSLPSNSTGSLAHTLKIAFE
ncbi:alpha-L-fucosidase [Fulvivirgaceae bacterium BMA12]|uniref:alpha-L-fucosidase n=1 Tax=Agaribacillus aureus TaxID=3051825 RepID=A0ABT8L3J0_9BACT|nr:alpha-L-fucosidase [Fulvivirgaceae bacterium BMA12]